MESSTKRTAMSHPVEAKEVFFRERIELCSLKKPSPRNVSSDSAEVHEKQYR
jgi:hypothetical protein